MKRTWRIPALILLPLLVVAGLAIEARDDDSAAAAARLSELTPTAATAGTPELHLVLRRGVGHGRDHR